MIIQNSSEWQRETNLLAILLEETWWRNNPLGRCFLKVKEKNLIFSFLMSLFHFISGYLNAVSENTQVTPIMLLHLAYKNRPTRQRVPSTTKNLILWTSPSGTFLFFWEKKSHIFQYILFHVFKSEEAWLIFLTEVKEFSIERSEIADLRYSKLPWAKF